MSPIITLLSDFGTADTFVGQMKGALLGRRPDAMLVDLTHEVPPQSILVGAFHLRAAWRAFPTGTVHLAVVDPGVGTDRRAIAVEYQGHTFVLPDNGLMTAVLDSAQPDAAVEIDPAAVNSHYISSTFHGRDIFAPAAGMLARGSDLTNLGERIDSSTLVRCPIPRVERHADALSGQIVLIDHFGNCISNISGELLAVGSRDFEVRSNNVTLDGVTRTYQHVNPGEPLALISSMGTLEIAVRDGSAAREFQLEIGTPVQVRYSSRR